MKLIKGWIDCSSNFTSFDAALFGASFIEALRLYSLVVDPKDYLSAKFYRSSFFCKFYKRCDKKTQIHMLNFFLFIINYDRTRLMFPKIVSNFLEIDEIFL